MTSPPTAGIGTLAIRVVSGPFTWGDASNIVAALGAALIAALVAVRGYSRQHGNQRQDDRATLYAEALQAVEDYLEGPYRIRRRDGSSGARRQITEDLSAVKSRINFHLAWLRIHGVPEIADLYRALVEAAQQDAGPQMTAAWRGPSTRSDREVPLGRGYGHVRADLARDRLLTAMEADLKR